MPFSTLYKNIFNREESDAGGKDMLSDIVKQYPYFSAAHFFLLKQTPFGDPAYNTIAATTALHFNNLFLLQHQLQQVTNNDHEFRSRETGSSLKLDEETLPGIDEDKKDVIHLDPIVTEEVKLVEVVEELPTENNDIGVAIPATLQTESVETPAESKTEIAPIDTIEEPLLFQPLFASDYFASQGIKLRDDVQPTDKLGKQLKSFTEWLKTMKKVHESKLPSGSETFDTSVQLLAEKSNLEEEVITETMAEVYLQQGKSNKAKEIYEKLSLLNPSKNAYFAAKIDQIQ